ncbi:MAG: zinc-dependent metalloprotease family protein [Pseudomonas putida]
MNKNICMALLVGVSLTMASACSSLTSSDNGTSSAVQQLFTLEPTPERNALQKTATGYLATVLADPSTQEITWIKVNPALVSNETQALAVTLPNGKTAAFNLRDFNTLTAGIEGWVGYTPSTWKQAHAPSSSAEIDNDPLFYLSLAKEDNNLVGNLVVEGQRYRIDPVGQGQYALVKIDESKLPPEGEPIRVTEASTKAAAASSGAVSTHSVIRVLFVSTHQSRAKYPDYRLRLAHVLQDANQYLKNSQVEITYELAGYYDANYNETSDSSGQLNDVRRIEADLGKAVYAQRDALRADLVSMLSTFSEVCGRAYLSSTKGTGYSVFSCIGGTLAHELGHNLGGNHSLDVPDPAKSYNHGYRHESPNFHTIMRTSHGAVGYFSNPRIRYQGVAMGTVQNHDNARRFNEYRETVENFYPPLHTPITVTLFEQDNFSGRSCNMTLQHIQQRNACREARSARVQGAGVHSQFCIGDYQATKESCYTVNSGGAGDYSTSNLDNPSTLPPNVTHRKVGAGAIGNTQQVRYQVFPR